MRELAIQLLVGFGGLLVLILSKTTIRYRVTKRFLIISWAGFPVRWVRLKNIRQIHTQRTFWAERWTSTLQHSNRYLVIRKYSGVFKNLVITPRNHMVFRADLERARNQMLALHQSAPGTAVPAGDQQSHLPLANGAAR